VSNRSAWGASLRRGTREASGVWEWRLQRSLKITACGKMPREGSVVTGSDWPPETKKKASRTIRDYILLMAHGDGTSVAGSELGSLI
jgi:hypothetical protein